MEGTRPERPENTLELGLSDEVWDMMQKCWSAEPTGRPKTSEVVRQLAWLVEPEKEVPETTRPPAPQNNPNEMLFKV